MALYHHRPGVCSISASQNHRTWSESLATCTRSSGNGIAASISTGIRHGVRGRLLRLIQWGSEADALQAYEGALNDGRSLVYVPVRDETQRARMADALRSSGGRHLLHFRLWRLSSCPRSVPVTTGSED